MTSLLIKWLACGLIGSLIISIGMARYYGKYTIGSLLLTIFLIAAGGISLAISTYLYSDKLDKILSVKLWDRK